MDWETAMEKTSAGKGRECAIKNPRKVCCHMDILRILELYAGKEGNPGNGCG